MKIIFCQARRVRRQWAEQVTALVRDAEAMGRGILPAIVYGSLCTK